MIRNEWRRREQAGADYRAELVDPLLAAGEKRG